MSPLDSRPLCAICLDTIKQKGAGIHCCSIACIVSQAKDCLLCSEAGRSPADCLLHYGSSDSFSVLLAGTCFDDPVNLATFRAKPVRMLSEDTLACKMNSVSFDEAFDTHVAVRPLAHVLILFEKMKL